MTDYRDEDFFSAWEDALAIGTTSLSWKLWEPQLLPLERLLQTDNTPCNSILFQ